jgi:hypothetical protein
LNFGSGPPDTIIRIRVVHNDRAKRFAEERGGTLADLAPWSWQCNQDGCNVYMVAQQTRSITGQFSSDADVADIRGLFADGDDTPCPAEWHATPTFVLTHPSTGRWWAFWRGDGIEVAAVRAYQERIALHYGSDTSVTNLSRIVRLAGFDRWRDGKNYGSYVLRETGGTTLAAFHNAVLPRSPPQPERSATPRDGGEPIGLARLRGLLACIDPYERDVWRNVCFAMRDAVILGDDGNPIEADVAFAVFDEWASGALWAKAVTP